MDSPSGVPALVCRPANVFVTAGAVVFRRRGGLRYFRCSCTSRTWVPLRRTPARSNLTTSAIRSSYHYLAGATRWTYRSVQPAPKESLEPRNTWPFHKVPHYPLRCAGFWHSYCWRCATWQKFPTGTAFGVIGWLAPHAFSFPPQWVCGLGWKLAGLCFSRAWSPLLPAITRNSAESHGALGSIYTVKPFHQLDDRGDLTMLLFTGYYTCSILRVAFVWTLYVRVPPQWPWMSVDAEGGTSPTTPRDSDQCGRVPGRTPWEALSHLVPP
jgi:hypothetical protein